MPPGEYGPEGPVYRVELLTADGVVPLTNSYTSDRYPKDEVAHTLNDFVQSGAPGSLSLVEPGMLSAGNLAMLLIMLALAAIWWFSVR